MTPLRGSILHAETHYTRVAVSTIRDVKSPLERIRLNLTKRPPA